MVFSVCGVEEEMHRSRPCLEFRRESLHVLHTSTSKPEDLMVKSNLSERFWTFLIVLLMILKHLQRIDTENVLRYRKFILKCWYSVPVCVKLGRNTEKQRKKSDKFDKLPLWGTGNIHMLYQSEMYLSKCQIF